MMKARRTARTNSTSCSSISRSERDVCGIERAAATIIAAAHEQSGQIGDEHAFSAGDGYKKYVDGGKRIDGEWRSTVSLELGDAGSPLDRVVRCRCRGWLAKAPIAGERG
ncbi:hypothetical protein DIE23_27220 [Burkholderia sp. Bp9143]|nr:hypothetical protein DIE23_27220 [Burkholderia sp. Bp9143]